VYLSKTSHSIRGGLVLYDIEECDKVVLSEVCPSVGTLWTIGVEGVLKRFNEPKRNAHFLSLAHCCTPAVTFLKYIRVRSMI
jgi:hypothetical protein